MHITRHAHVLSLLFVNNADGISPFLNPDISVAAVCPAQVDTSELACNELSSQLLTAAHPKVAQCKLLP